MRYVDSGMGEDLSKLPQRHLPPGTVADLYREYVISAGRAVASEAVFRREYTQHWHSILQFRPPSEFADCDRCTELRQQMRDAKSVEAIALASKELQEHYRHVQSNRDLEESFRTTTPFDIEKPILFVMTDGMEQSKWAIPRRGGSHRMAVYH